MAEQSTGRSVLITGSPRGQLYHALHASCPETIRLVGPEERLDITDPDAVHDAFERFAPDVVINAAAYTAVDQAETAPVTASAINSDGPALLARAARSVDARLVHVSTDFVFGDGHCRPILPDAATAPLGVYGASKLAGEHAVTEILGARALIVRTAWVYGAHGGNFVKTMLRLMNERDEIRVVADQIGSPTWTRPLANALWRAAASDLDGVCHVTGTGIASWYDLAVAILEEADSLELFDRPGRAATVRILPITTEEYPTPARRPAYSVLDNRRARTALDLPVVHWRQELRTMLGELK